MKKNKLLYFLIASSFTLTSCNSNTHTDEPIDSTSDTHTEEQPIDARPIILLMAQPCLMDYILKQMLMILL